MSLNNENCDSSDDESSTSIIFSSGRSSPTWSRSSSMTSGISAISTSSSEDKKKLKSLFGPITRPSTTELKFDEPRKECQCQVQQVNADATKIFERKPTLIQNSQELLLFGNNPKTEQPKNAIRKNIVPVPSKIVRPTANIFHTQTWFYSAYPHPMRGSPMPHFPPPMMYYPPPPIPMPMVYPTPVPMMPLPFMGPPMYHQPQVHVVSMQAHYTTTSWTYTEYV